jgi:hypothetical protein
MPWKTANIITSRDLYNNVIAVRSVMNAHKVITRLLPEKQVNAVLTSRTDEVQYKE